MVPMPAAARYRAESPGSDQEDLGLGQFDLSLAADLVEDDVPAIALYLLFGKFHSTRLSSFVKREAVWP